MTIHLVYPYAAPPDRHHAAPWTIGRELGRGLRRLGYQVQQYDWECRDAIYPGSPEDVLIGHPHPEPGRTFRQSAAVGFRHNRTIAMAPWNGTTEYTHRIDMCRKHVDHILAICGPYWARRLPWSNATALNMAIDSEVFPLVPRKIRPPGHRRVLFIGCTLPVKAPEIIADLARRYPHLVGHAGYGSIPGATEHGWQDWASPAGRDVLSGYDFIIAPSSNDANPTTVLEAMCWGLVPMWCEGSGWGDDVCGIMWGAGGAIRAMDTAQRTEPEVLKRWTTENRRLAEQHYTWARFTRTVAGALEGRPHGRNCENQSAGQDRAGLDHQCRHGGAECQH
ncbi:MAG: glycosyltransferase family protein [Planctomycetota bacterium]